MKTRILSACLCVLLAVAICGCGKTDDNGKVYRNVKVTDISGSATLSREAKQQPVYKQMVINGDDNIITAANSTVDLLIDSDKYARIYENSDVTFKLEGDPSKGAIRIYLNKGKINSKIENKLSAGDSYEVHTPDAVMAVRGTEFDVTVNYTEDGRQTEVNTSNGSVEITLLGGSGEKKVNEEGETTVIESKVDGNGEMGKPEFKNELPTVICPKCQNALEQGKTHLLVCGEEHYSCDEKDHSTCPDCKKNVCDLSTHELLECGNHYLCSLADREMVIHSMYCVVCKVYACESDKSHTWANCGCVTCIGELGKNHISCDACGRCKSDNQNHGDCDFCYSCTGDGQNHGDGVCNIELQ